MGEDGVVKLMDFGIARLLRPSQFTSTGLALGTAYYMAPEQLRGQAVDHRADQFAVGVILYELLTGQVPVGAVEPPHEVRRSIPGPLSQAVMKALAGDPGKRHADIAALQRALEAGSRSGLGKRAAAALLATILLISAVATFPSWRHLLREASNQNPGEGLPNSIVGTKKSMDVEGLLAAGERGVKAHAYREAVEHFDQVIALRPRASKLASAEGADASRLRAGLSQALRGRAEAYTGLAGIEHAGELVRILADCNEAIRFAPTSAPAFVSRAMAYLSAYEVLSFPDELGRAMAYLKDNEISRGITDPGEAGQIAAKSARTYFVRMGLADSGEAVRLDPKSAKALFVRMEAIQVRTRQLFRESDFGRHEPNEREKKELAAYEVEIDAAIPRLEPNSASDFCYRAMIYLMVKDDAGRALADWDKAIRLDPKAPMAYVMRAHFYSAKGDHDREIEDLSRAIRLDPKKAWAHHDRGFAFYDKKKNFDQAIADLTEAIRLEPKYFDAYLCRRDAWKDKGDFDKALADASQAIRLDPYFPLSYSARAEIFSVKGNHDQAIADYSETIRLLPDSMRFVPTHGPRSIGSWGTKKPQGPTMHGRTLVINTKI